MSEESYEAMAPFIEKLEAFTELIVQADAQNAEEVSVLEGQAATIKEEAKNHDDPIVSECLSTLDIALGNLRKSAENPVGDLAA